jgi:hypothetical protein
VGIFVTIFKVETTTDKYVEDSSIHWDRSPIPVWMNKELVVAECEILLQSGRTQKSTKNSVKMIGVRSEVLTQDLSKNKTGVLPTGP